MVDSHGPRVRRGRARSSRARTQGEAFGGAKGEPEDADPAQRGRVIRVRGSWNQPSKADEGGAPLSPLMASACPAAQLPRGASLGGRKTRASATFRTKRTRRPRPLVETAAHRTT